MVARKRDCEIKAYDERKGNLFWDSSEAMEVLH